MENNNCNDTLFDGNKGNYRGSYKNKISNKGHKCLTIIFWFTKSWLNLVPVPGWPVPNKILQLMRFRQKLLFSFHENREVGLGRTRLPQGLIMKRKIHGMRTASNRWISIADLLIYWIKRRFLHKDKVQHPQESFRTAPTWPLFRCNWRSWSHVKTLYKRSLIMSRNSLKSFSL